MSISDKVILIKQICETVLKVADVVIKVLSAVVDVLKGNE